MSRRMVATYVIAALAAGLVLGSFGIATAAPSKASSATVGAQLRLGASVRAAKATLADVVSKLTGTPVAEVREERTAGKSLAAIAGEKGVSADKVVAETLAARKAMLAGLVKQGKITQAQADAALARMTTRLTERVNSAAACTGAGSGACGSGACGSGAGGGGGFGGGASRGRMGGAGAGCTGRTTTATQ